MMHINMPKAYAKLIDAKFEGKAVERFFLIDENRKSGFNSRPDKKILKLKKSNC